MRGQGLQDGRVVGMGHHLGQVLRRHQHHGLGFPAHVGGVAGNALRQPAIVTVAFHTKRGGALLSVDDFSAEQC